MNRVLWGLALSASFAAADALIVTRAMKATTIMEVFVDTGEVRVELEIAAGDAESFSNLLAHKGDTPESLPKRLALFFRADLVISADGAALVGRVEGLQARRRVMRDEITGGPVGESDETVLFLRLRYPLAGAPRTFAIKAPASANIGFVVYHEGVALNDFRYLTGEQIADLDWTDPFFSRFRGRNLRRRYDSPLNGFLYMDSFEARKEIICRPRDLGIETGTVIKAAERDEIKRRMVAFLKNKNPVTIDGQPARGELDRIHFIRRSLKTTGVIPADEDIPAVSAMLGVIYVYPVVGLPRKVSMKWELFTPRVSSVPAVATDEAGGMPSFLTRDDPYLRWENFLKNPSSAEPAVIPPPRPRSWLLVWCTLTLVAAGLLTRRRVGIIAGSVGAAAFLAVWLLQNPSPVPRKAEAEQVVGGLLRNLYRAFDHRGENAIYDTLQRSVDGELLRRIYIETRRSLELANQGAARAKVKQVEIESTEELAALDDGPGFALDCAWKVAGAVGHWGHIHIRRNKYEARIVIRPINGVWKITDLEILDEQRL